jgi:hypothetical protein
MVRRFPPFILITGVLLFFIAGPAWAQENFASRPITLPKGLLRLDLAPPDYGYMEHGELNRDRGLQLRVDEGNDPNLGLGLGASYGITSDFEVGGLLFPFIFAPDFDFGDMELFGRYGFVRGNVQLAGQLTLRIPTQRKFGLGFGLPMLFRISNSFLIDSGIELEIIFPHHGDEYLNLDLPLAFNFDIGRSAFLGFRTGVLVVHMDDAAINLGLQGGLRADRSVHLTASFNWPRFIWTGPGDAVNPDTFEVIFGISIFVDVL